MVKYVSNSKSEFAKKIDKKVAVRITGSQTIFSSSIQTVQKMSLSCMLHFWSRTNHKYCAVPYQVDHHKMLSGVHVKYVLKNVAKFVQTVGFLL